MEEGGICLWDLEEADSRHPSEAVGGAQLCTRRPAYTTECSPDMASSGAPVVSVVAVPRGAVFRPLGGQGIAAAEGSFSVVQLVEAIQVAQDGVSTYRYLAYIVSRH